MSAESLKSELESRVGIEVHVGPWLTITQERIDQFAKATEDFQWIHTDTERAERESPFGTTIAHGYLTLSLLPYLSGYVNPEEPIYPEASWIVNYGMNRMRFPHPVKVGDRVKISASDSCATTLANEPNPTFQISQHPVPCRYAINSSAPMETLKSNHISAKTSLSGPATDNKQLQQL